MGVTVKQMWCNQNIEKEHEQMSIKEKVNLVNLNWQI